MYKRHEIGNNSKVRVYSKVVYNKKLTNFIRESETCHGTLPKNYNAEPRWSCDYVVVKGGIQQCRRGNHAILFF